MIIGELDLKNFEKQTYRMGERWRTTALRTYLHKIYQKIDQKDFIDPLMTKTG